MGMYLQGSLFDQADDAVLGPLRGVRRTELGGGAWIDLLTGWLRGADDLFVRLAADVPWKAERRRMYDRPISAEKLRKRLHVGAARSRMLVAMVRSTRTDHLPIEASSAEAGRATSGPRRRVDGAGEEGSADD